MESIKAEIAATAARLVVEEGLEYGPAKRRAVRQLGVGARAALPGNEELHLAVREYIELFCADSQPGEMRALRELALAWMERLSQFRPHVTGAVWQGTATRLSDIHLQLFCDDPKSLEIELVNRGIFYDVGAASDFRGQPVDSLHLTTPCAALGETIGLHLTVLDHDDLRGALKPDAQGQPGRGDARALRQRMAGQTQHA